MRTNIILNDELVDEAMRYAKSKTRSGLVEEALRTFVEVRSAEERRRTYRERLRALEDRLHAVRLRQTPRDLLRADRDRR
jgi:Arc/MetJ family transcription regulator